jgi:hypothetical protein
VSLKIVSHAGRPEFEERWYDVIRQVWPEFMGHDTICNQFWGGMYRHYPECQLYLIDDETDALVGAGTTVPVVWDGTVEGLPGGVDEVLLAAIRDRESQAAPTTLCAMQAGILPGHRGEGLSRVIIGAMREVAASLGLPDLIAPVRPNQKAFYPLTPIERYVTWTRDDGLPCDPWLRVHARLGAEIVRIAERSMTISGTVADWESWTGLALPDSGEYVVPGALVPVVVDRDADSGLYVEPNVWMRHRLTPRWAQQAAPLQGP